MSTPTQGQATDPDRKPELLAPAGDWAAMEAALEAGAGAIYLGLTSLNARRRARNFGPEELVRAVEAIHARGAKAYLTLNVDLSDRDLGQAARILELAHRSGVDALLVRDPALLALKAQYADLEFHFSTQTCMTNSADVAAAGHLGAARVVLARELTLEEIAAASAVPGVATEVFVQGALCFCVSGRCLLSSWAGGRSGNRGTCTSPCRVPWAVEGQSVGTPFSMRDLAAVHRLDDLRRAGVAALKIEGRLKTADWVRRAVGLYRDALDGNGADPNELLARAADLGDYTGRTVTSDYLDGRRDALTGVWGRPASGEPAAEDAAPCGDSTPAEQTAESADDLEEDSRPDYELEILVSGRAIVCRCTCGEVTAEWTYPKSVVRRAHKAVSVGTLLVRLDAISIRGYRPRELSTDDPEFLLVPRTANAIVDRIGATLHQAAKGPNRLVRLELPEPVREILAGGSPSSANQRTLGDKADRARLDAGAVGEFLRNVQPEAVIVEGLTAASLERTWRACRDVALIAALPPVFFEEDLAEMEKLLRACGRAGVTVEVNSWGAWRLANQAGVRTEGGPGLAVLNWLAARRLADAGLRSATFSPEASRRQLEDLSAHCPVRSSLVVFGRPPVLTTRVNLPEEYLDRVFSDRRSLEIVPRRERGLWVFRPVEPFDLRGCANERIRAHHLVVDLVGSEDPVGDWLNVPLPDTETFRFNYDRALM